MGAAARVPSRWQHDGPHGGCRLHPKGHHDRPGSRAECATTVADAHAGHEPAALTIIQSSGRRCNRKARRWRTPPSGRFFNATQSPLTAAGYVAVSTVAIVESFSPDDLPLYDIDGFDWGVDLQSLSRELFGSTYQGLRRLSDGTVVVYRNDDLRALGMHKAVSHELPPPGTPGLDLDRQTLQWLRRMGDNNPFVARPPEHMPKKQLGMRRLTTISMSRYADAAAEIVDTLAAGFLQGVAL